MVKHLAWDKPELTINNPFEPGCSLNASGRSRLSPNLFRSHCSPPGIPPETCWLAQSSSVGQAQLFGPDPNNPNNPDLILLQTFNDPTTGKNSNEKFSDQILSDGDIRRDIHIDVRAAPLGRSLHVTFIRQQKYAC